MRIEQAIEDMVQEGYLVYKVLMFHTGDCIGGRWIPLEETDPVPDSATVWIFGKRADDDKKSFMMACDDMQWLRDWWKGGWQANI